MPATIRHIQRQRMSGVVFAGIAATCAAFLGAGLFPDLPVALRIAFLCGAGLMLLVVLEFDRLTIVVTGEDLLAGFHLFRSRTPLREIESASRVDVKLFTHGIGVHFTLRGELAITARTGPGVEVRRRGRRALVLSSDDPEALVRALTEAIAALRERRPA